MSTFSFNELVVDESKSVMDYVTCNFKSNNHFNLYFMFEEATFNKEELKKKQRTSENFRLNKKVIEALMKLNLLRNSDSSC